MVGIVSLICGVVITGLVIVGLVSVLLVRVCVSGADNIAAWCVFAVNHVRVQVRDCCSR